MLSFTDAKSILSEDKNKKYGKAFFFIPFLHLRTINYANPNLKRILFFSSFLSRLKSNKRKTC
jgi:hypothetical protein